MYSDSGINEFQNLHTLKTNFDCMGTVFRFTVSAVENDQVDRVAALIEKASETLREADRIFSLYKPDSPLARLARGEVSIGDCPPEVAMIWDQCERWEIQTSGYFSALNPQRIFDPSGLVKAWAAERAADILRRGGVQQFTLNAGGDVLIAESTAAAELWRVAISKPISIASPDFELLTVLDLANTGFCAVATSGSAERGAHIWNPREPGKTPDDLLAATVVAADLVTADIWATAIFAEGRTALDRIDFATQNIEALVVTRDGEPLGSPGLTRLLAR